MQYKNVCKQGFSLAEAMITLLIVSLILAAVVPVVSKRQATPDKIWNYTYTTTGTPTANIYWGIKDGQTAVIGGHSVPDSALGARLSLITAADNAALTDQVLRYSIRRPLLSFFQRSGTTVVPLGKISFDQWSNTSIGQSTLSNTIPTVIDSTVATPANENVVDSGMNDRGSLNTAVGFGTLFSNTTGARNIAIGSNSLISNTTGFGNTSIGVNSLRANISGISNVAAGTSALMLNTIGGDNTAIGAQALKHNTDASYNTAIGSHALWSNEKGTTNIAIGVNAMRIANWYANTSTQNNYSNIAIGWSALYNNTGQHNIAIGADSQTANTTGYYNISIGDQSLRSNVMGTYNTTVGTHTLLNTTGSWNVALGYGAGSSAGAVNEMLYIEGRGDQHAPGDNLIEGSFTAANRYVKINGTLYNQAGGVIAASDRRLKKDIKEENTGLEDILKLQIKSYKFNDDKKQRTHVGVIAQELQEIMPDAVLAGPGNDKFKEILFVDQNYILFKLVNAVKQLYTKTMSNLNRIIVLEKEIKDLKSQNKHLKKELASVEERLDRLERQHPVK